jgi:hypothetical protein
MSNDDDIKWVALTLNFKPEVEAKLETHARAAGLSLKCYCVHVLYRHLSTDASDAEKERWGQGFPATLRRNGCDEQSKLP